MKAFNPVGGRQGSLEEKGTHNVVNGAKNAFGLAILGGGVGTGHSEKSAVSEEERASRRIVKFTSIITLDAFDGAAKLSGHIGKEICQSGKSLGLEPQRESPEKVRVIIKNSKIIFIPRHTVDRRGPQITVN